MKNKPKRRKSKTPISTKNYTAKWPTYTLLDSGKGRKLEQFGEYRLVRPEPRAHWRPVWSEEEWAGADAEYVLANESSPKIYHRLFMVQMNKSGKFIMGV